MKRAIVTSVLLVLVMAKGAPVPGAIGAALGCALLIVVIQVLALHGKRP